MRIAGGFEINIHPPAGRDPVGVFIVDPFDALHEIVGREAVETFHRDRQVGRLGEPIVDQLVCCRRRYCGCVMRMSSRPKQVREHASIAAMPLLKFQAKYSAVYGPASISTM